MNMIKITIRHQQQTVYDVWSNYHFFLTFTHATQIIIPQKKKKRGRKTVLNVMGFFLKMKIIVKKKIMQ